MIKIEHVVMPSPEQMETVIRGMRNPMNSWAHSDSYMTYVCDDSANAEAPHSFVVGDDDLTLMEKLAALGSDHGKFLRMMAVYMDITAPLYWWKEYDTYKVGTVANSCSTMHKIHDKEFTLDDFSHEKLKPSARTVLEVTIGELNFWRDIYNNGGVVDENRDGYCVCYEPKDKAAWEQMIQLLPASFNQKRTVMLNYEVLRNMYRARKNHKLQEWRDFCVRIENLPYSDVITG